ncbi:MAG: hypothetical protein JHC74_09105 [Thermoleophilia bacterium]|nr:hypothetical protein [Thermoleophilia bacterium]
MVPTGQIDSWSLPRVAEGAEFVPLEDLRGAPHFVVDGVPLPGTALSLSHRPGGGTPAGLRDDTSALIVDRYLDAGASGDAVWAVTNDHYDEDGLFGIWMLLEQPAKGSPARALAIAASEAGDFSTWTDPWAPRVAIAAMAMAERATTPFPEVGRALARAGGRDPAGLLYRAILPRTGGLLADPERYRFLWRDEWERVEADIALLDTGGATIEDEPAADLAILGTPRPLHPMAVYPRTRRTRVLTVIPDGTLVLAHRYETWIEYVSRDLPPRVDLTPLAEDLQRRETRPGRWLFEGVQVIMPRLYLAGGAAGAPGPAPSSIPAERLVADLIAFLEAS